MENNEKMLIEYLGISLITIFKAKRSIEDEMPVGYDIYSPTAIDILEQTTIFSIQNSKKCKKEKAELDFRNMYFFYLNEYQNQIGNSQKEKTKSLRAIRRQRKMSLEEPLFDISFDDLGVEDGNDITIDENSEVALELIKIISGKSDRVHSKKNPEINHSKDDDRLNPNLYKKEIESEKSSFMISKNPSK